MNSSAYNESAVEDEEDLETQVPPPTRFRLNRRPTAIRHPRPLPPVPIEVPRPYTLRRTTTRSTQLSLLSTSLPSHRTSSPSPVQEGDDNEGHRVNMSINNSNTFPALDTSFSNRSPSLAASGQANGGGMNNNASNNNNAQNYMAPLPVGHQQDLNYLYAQIQELSGILQSNRDKVNDITRSAEEVARRANSANGNTDGDGDHEADKANIRELSHDLAKANHIISLYKHEQTENTKLIAQYEDALGTATDQIRNYTDNIDGRFLGQRRHYNNLLQAEKDEHLQSRLDRDHWHSQTLRLAEMIRTAYRLRCEEWNDEYRVVVGLQSEVRCLRRCMGIEAQKPEEETGWPYLKDAPFDDQN